MLSWGGGTVVGRSALGIQSHQSVTEPGQLGAARDILVGCRASQQLWQCDVRALKKAHFFSNKCYIICFISFYNLSTGKKLTMETYSSSSMGEKALCQLIQSPTRTRS